MGSPSQQPSLIAMEVLDASTWDVINSGATASVAAEASGVLRSTQVPELDGGAGCWLLRKDRPADPIPEWGKEQRPQLLWAQSLLMAGSNGVDHYDARNVYQVGQVVC